MQEDEDYGLSAEMSAFTDWRADNEVQLLLTIPHCDSSVYVYTRMYVQYVYSTCAACSERKQFLQQKKYNRTRSVVVTGT